MANKRPYASISRFRREHGKIAPNINRAVPKREVLSFRGDMMRQRMVMGNWKMNGCLETINLLVRDVLQLLPKHQQSQVMVFPPAVYLPLVQTLLSKSAIQWGAQNVYPAASGAYTGEISTQMLQDFACRYVLVGHSERRHVFGEKEHFIAKKFHHVKESGMIPVLCVGETLDEREQGLMETVIARQLMTVCQGKNDVFNQCIIAYEPVWAIGTGKTATAEQAQIAHHFIRQVIAESEALNATRVPILYGGSLNEGNAAALFSMPDVDGGLVGGASLHARQFVEIIKCIS